MEITTDPVFIQDSDVNIRGNVVIELCREIDKRWIGEALGAQKFHQVWKIYVKSPPTRAALIVSGLNVNGKNVSVYDENPNNDNNKLSERVVIKDLPATIPPDRILSSLRGLPQTHLKFRVLYAKERIRGEEMSPYINGDLLVYIAPNPSPPLPKETIIAGHPCRIWHKSQKNYCKRCDSYGHRTSDNDLCQSYEADESVSPFRADSNPLSNFFRCMITIQGRDFRTSEHAYQYTKCMFLDNTDLAEQVISAETPHDAKAVASRVNCDVRMAEWDKIRVDAMSKILKFKWNSSGRFRQTLMATSNMTIAEATSDMFWGVGVAPNLALHTNPKKFLGQNHLGKCLMELRAYVHDQNPTSINDLSFNLSPLGVQPNSLDSSRVDPSTSGTQGEGGDSKPSSSECPSDSGKASSNDTEDPLSRDSMDTSPSELNSSPDDLDPPPNQTVCEQARTETSDPSSLKNETTDVIHPGSDTENIDGDCETVPPALFSTPFPPTGHVAQRKSRSLKPELRRNLSQGSLDTFVISRESSSKRKPSGDVTVSPSSDHATKVSRSDVVS